jgi:glucan phosphorylase
MRSSAGLIASTDLSLEFLMGRALDNAMLNVGLKDVAKGELGKYSLINPIIMPIEIGALECIANKNS